MSAAIGAALAGARTITATSSQGSHDGGGRLHRRLMRAPIAVAIGNRALGPINIHADHWTRCSCDSGVIQLFAEDGRRRTS